VSFAVSQSCTEQRLLDLDNIWRWWTCRSEEFGPDIPISEAIPTSSTPSQSVLPAKHLSMPSSCLNRRLGPRRAHSTSQPLPFLLLWPRDNDRRPSHTPHALASDTQLRATRQTALFVQGFETLVAEDGQTDAADVTGGDDGAVAEAGGAEVDVDAGGGDEVVAGGGGREEGGEEVGQH